MVDLAALRDHLTAPLRGRPLLLGVAPAGALTDQVRQLEEDGLGPVLVLTSSPAPQPAGGNGPRYVHVQAAPATTLAGSIRADQAVQDQLPPHALAAIEAHDPRREGVWLGHPFLQRTQVAGRPVLGGRPPAWAELEDKTTCDRLLDAAGVPRGRSEVVPASLEDLLVAARRLDAGSGTVWSGDSTSGVNGGAELVRWVRSAPEGRDAAQWLGSRCRRVRVAPFHQGVPCSVHGIVLPDGVAAGRPVELVNLRRRGTSSFVPAGLSTWWDPPRSDREAMRDAVRRLGGYLRAAYGYAGAFGVDGVLTADGWLPTEVNTRPSTGLALLLTAVPGLPFWHLQRTLASGAPAGVGAAELEELLVPAADTGRAGSVRAFSPVPGRVEVAVRGRPPRLRVAGAGAPGGVAVTGTLRQEPVMIGSVVTLTPLEGAVRAGDRMAGWAVAALALADEVAGTGFGPTLAAPDVRTGGEAPSGAAPPVRSVPGDGQTGGRSS